MNTDLNQIAIVGMSCRLPGSRTLDEFWHNLIHGNVCTEQERHFSDGGVGRGGFLENIDAFDADFFNISPIEAISMDPQLRQLLEVSYEAIQCSGASIETLQRLKTGVFTTSLPGDYKNLLKEDANAALSTHSFLGNAPSAMSGRLSYFYQFNGPSITIDSACSSGLTTLNMAKLSILNEDCQAALVGGVSIFSTSMFHQLATESQMLSPSLKCRTFDQNADGFVASEGVVVLLIMKYDTALTLKLPIYALIDTLHLNHNGFSNGLMAPHAKQQQALIQFCYQKASLTSADVALIEAHGTGTMLGDPIELKGLSNIMPVEDSNVYLGASKTVIGHTLVVSSLASIVKVLLAYEHQTIPPHPLFEKQNPHAIFPSFLTINQKAVDWPANKYYASVSAFGFTGSNAHLILKYLPKKTFESHDFSSYFLFSAPNLEKCLQYLITLKKWLIKNPSAFKDVSARLIKQPKHFSVRFAIYATHLDELLNAMTDAIHASLQLPLNQIHNHSAIVQNNAYQAILKWLNGDDAIIESVILPISSMPLPHYAFSKERYWVTNTPAVVTPPESQEDNTKNLTQVKKGLSNLLGYLDADINEEKSLLELGIDSLTSIQLIHFLKTQGLHTDIEWVWGAPSLKIFAKKIKPAIPLKNRTVEIDGIEALNFSCFPSHQMLWLVSRNEGIPILLLPPLNCHYQAWLRQIVILQKSGYQIHTPYYPGHHPLLTLDASLSLQKIADHIGAYIKTLPRKCHIVGWSLGGVLSLLLAQSAQSHILSIIFIACSAEFDSELFEKTIEMQHELTLHAASLQMVFQTTSAIKDNISAKASMDILKTYYLELMALSIKKTMLESIRLPTLFIYGAKDPVVGEKQRQFMRHIPNAQEIIYSEGGHFIPLCFPKEFNEQLLTFISRTDENYDTII